MNLILGNIPCLDSMSSTYIFFFFLHYTGRKRQLERRRYECEISSRDEIGSCYWGI